MGAGHHVAVMMGSDYNKIYIDGVRPSVTYNSGGGPTGSPTTGDCMWRGTIIEATIGDYPGGIPGYKPKGKIDEVMIYNRALTEEEIQQLYLGGSDPIPRGGKIVFESSRTGNWEIFLLDELSGSITTWILHESNRLRLAQNILVPLFPLAMH